MVTRNIFVFGLQRVAPYFKGMPNSIEFYKRIFLHVIPARVIVPKSYKKSKPGNAFNCLLHENKTVPMTNFEDKTNSVIKMSKSDLTNNALEGENDGIEESENSDDE